MDGTPVDPHAETVVDIKPGVRTLTFAFDPEHHQERLRCELDDAPGSPARARWLSGK